MLVDGSFTEYTTGGTTIVISFTNFATGGTTIVASFINFTVILADCDIQKMMYLHKIHVDRKQVINSTLSLVSTIVIIFLLRFRIGKFLHYHVLVAKDCTEVPRVKLYVTGLFLNLVVSRCCHRY